MESNKDNEFKVVDRRSSSGTTDEVKEKAGDSFVMKDPPQTAPPSPTQIDFSMLVFSFAQGSFISLGLAPDPNTKKTQKNLEVARQNIEILGMLKEKTKGNLTSEESALLENLLTEIRLRFVEASK